MFIIHAIQAMFVTMWGFMRHLVTTDAPHAVLALAHAGPVVLTLAIVGLAAALAVTVAAIEKRGNL